MAKKFNIHFVCDTDYLSIYPNLSAENFQKFQDNPLDFEDQRAYYVVYFREANVEDENSNIFDLDANIYYNQIDPARFYDEDDEDDEDDPVADACRELVAINNSLYSSIKKLKPNSITVIQKWHTYKEMDDYELLLDDHEDFDADKLQFVMADFFPDWEFHNGHGVAYESELIWDIFIEDRIGVGNLLYDNKIITIVDSEDLGSYITNQYVIRTDSEGKVLSIEETKVGD